MASVQRQLQNPTVLYYAWDHLGTIRLITNDDASLVERHDYEPYGLELPPYVNQSANTHQFTGHERDLTSGFDYMHFRYFGSTMGRFCKPDNISGKLANPQSWNRYSYVVGNPVNFNDPTGHWWNNGSVGSDDCQHPGAYGDEGGALTFSSGALLPEGMGTIGSDSAGRLNDLFKSIEKPAQGSGQTQQSSTSFHVNSWQDNLNATLEKQWKEEFSFDDYQFTPITTALKSEDVGLVNVGASIQGNDHWTIPLIKGKQHSSTKERWGNEIGGAFEMVAGAETLELGGVLLETTLGIFGVGALTFETGLGPVAAGIVGGFTGLIGASMAAGGIWLIYDGGKRVSEE